MKRRKDEALTPSCAREHLQDTLEWHYRTYSKRLEAKRRDGLDSERASEPKKRALNSRPLLQEVCIREVDTRALLYTVLVA